MSEQTKTKLPVPEGQSFLLRTQQMAPNEKGFVGYETIWEPVHKVVPYTTPKRP